VTYAGLLAGRGVVVVTHGALRTTYEPVTAAVRPGQQVALGEVLGRLAPGHLGCPATACLHWGLRRGEQYLDPVRLVRPGPVRLLPLNRAAPAAGSATGLVQASGSSGALRPERVLAPPPAPQQPSWSLRAAEAPLGSAALLVLVLGIGLLARPRPVPPAPAGAGAASVAVPPATGPAGGDADRAGLLLDLDEARARRRNAVRRPGLPEAGGAVGTSVVSS
jgi:hypothetical protein